MRITCLVIAAFCAAAFLPHSFASILYVNKNATGAVHDGKSWASAYTSISNAVSFAQSGDEIWVAASTPAAPAYSENFRIGTAVALYGGFSGTESQRSQRNWKSNVTTLEGSQTGIILQIYPTGTESVIVDGFTVRNGNTGMSVFRGNATIANNVITGTEFGITVDGGTTNIINSTISGSASGVYADGGSATLSNSTVSESGNGVYVRDAGVTIANTALWGNGDGVRIDEGTVTILGGTIRANSNDGVEVHSGTATVSNVVISANVGHGVYVAGRATIANATVSGNGGYGVCVSGGTATVTNATLCGNGGGVFARECSASIANTIIAFNGSYGVDAASGGNIAVFSHDDVYGNATSNYLGFSPPTDQGNLTLDPKLSNAYHDVHIQPASPCRDAGDNAFAIGTADIDGQPG